MQRKPRPWRQLRFWIRQWPADPQVRVPVPMAARRARLSLAASAGASRPALRRRRCATYTVADWAARVYVTSRRPPARVGRQSVSVQRRVSVCCGPGPSVSADWADKAEPELVSLAGEGRGAGHSGGSVRQRCARRAADTSDPETHSPAARRRNEGTDFGGRLWDALAAADTKHPEAAGGLLQ